MANLINGFLKDADDLMTQMHAAIRERQFDTFAERAHALKGSAGNIGAVELYRECGVVSDLADDEFMDRGAAAVAAIQQSLDRSRIELLRYLRERHWG
jgi:two-component system sensor histidine kinase RpfC